MFQFLQRDPLMFHRSKVKDFAELRRHIYNSGCVVVRGLISPERMTHFTQMANRSFDACQRILSILDLPPDVKKEDCSDPRLARFVGNVSIGQVEANYFSQTNEGRKIDDILMGDPAQRKFVTALLGSEWYPGASVLRKITPDPSQNGKGVQQPIVMHCDGPYLSKHTYALNFWVPTVSCPSDAPGLQLVPGPFEPMREAYEHNWETQESNLIKGDALQKFYSAGEDGKSRYVPDLKPGDVVIFHNWIMHASYATSSMTKPRTSFELRFNAPERSMFEAFAA